jgi:cytochrome c
MNAMTIVMSGVLCLSVSTAANAVDEKAARALYRSASNNCFMCHSVDKDKDGPAYHKVAEKYQGSADAEDKLIQHVTSGRIVKFPDGHEEEHKIINETDPEKIRNLVQWILAQ